jgi:hypothetical protein
VKKQSARQEKAPGDAKVGHLEETLTQFTNTTAQRLKRWKTPLITLIVLLAVVRLAYYLADSFRESSDVQIAEREYELFGSQAAQKDDYEADGAKVQALLDEVAGKKEEKFVAKAAVDYYLDRAERLTQKSKASSAEKGSQEKPAEGAETAAQAEKARDRALKIAAETAKRHTDDMDIQSWALAVKARVEGERNKSWLPPGRKYTFPPAPQPPVTPEQPAPAPALEKASSSAEGTPPAASQTPPAQKP